MCFRSIKNKGVSTFIIEEVNSILKVCALRAYNRGDIAVLSDKKWRAVLNKKAKSVNFSEAFKTILISGAY
jgi:hypothetical protein